MTTFQICCVDEIIMHIQVQQSSWCVGIINEAPVHLCAPVLWLYLCHFTLITALCGIIFISHSALRNQRHREVGHRRKILKPVLAELGCEARLSGFLAPMLYDLKTKSSLVAAEKCYMECYQDFSANKTLPPFALENDVNYDYLSPIPEVETERSKI